MSISLFLKQACKIGTSRLYVTPNSAVIRGKTRRRMHPRKTVIARNGISKNFRQLIKILNEATDSSSGVRGEGSSRSPGLRCRKTRFYNLIKEVYSIFKKHINLCNTEVNVLFCLRGTEWVVRCRAGAGPATWFGDDQSGGPPGLTMLNVRLQ